MPNEPQSQPWPGKRAILLVHGIGNAGPGDYTSLVAAVKDALGAEAATTAIYQLFYDQINDWFVTKTKLTDGISAAVQAVREKIDDAELAPTLADYMGDILWPVLSADARAAIRELYVAQLQRIVADGMDSGVPVRRQQLSIICHSLGCFHTYETLHHIALHPSLGLQPVTHEVVFRNVIFMASPVQLIRSVADAMGPLVPNKRWLYTARPEGLFIPTETSVTGVALPSVKRWASITGELDPVGGFFFRSKAPWAYMDVDGQESFIDDQRALTFASKQDFVKAFASARRDQLPPLVTPNDPHSWDAYVTRNAARLNTWITT